MKKFFTTLVAIVLVVGGLGYVFRESLWESAQQAMTKDMFVAADTDSFDPGVAIGHTFPAIKAIHNGQEITSITHFAADKGLLFIANRSASW